MKRVSLLMICVLAVVLTAGCSGKEFAYVEGTVKINGEAIEGAIVTFSPEEGGRSAFGKTDAAGHYELDYTSGDKGAKLGMNKVYLTTLMDPTLDDNNRVVVEGSPERFPPEWNENPSETREVVKGKNTFDFDVQTSESSYRRSAEVGNED